MENIPPAFWVYAVGVLSGVLSMTVPCWLAILASRGAYEISACGVQIKAANCKRAQALFLAALEAHSRMQQRAAQTFKARVSSGLDARQPGGGYQPVAGQDSGVPPEPPHGATSVKKFTPIYPEKGPVKNDGREPGKRRPAGDK